MPEHLVPCFFVLEGSNKKEPISSMPLQERLSIDLLLKEIETHISLGTVAIDLFAFLPKEKRDPFGSFAYTEGNLLSSAISQIKKEFPELVVMADIALDPYTDHGHDGVLDKAGRVDNDQTVHLLAKMALLVAEAGADIVAPSDMMDGRVGFLRDALDDEGFENVGILSYTAKYASSLYGPFRDALLSSPKLGDKKGYQMNPANRREALREALLDIDEGADMLLIKPAMTNLDIIQSLKNASTLPIGAYHVSGEYSMVMAAAKMGWLDPKKVFFEQFLSLRRAGADFILTYATKQLFTDADR